MNSSNSNKPTKPDTCANAGLAAVFVAEWEGEQLRSDECKPKEQCGDSDWWFDKDNLMFKRYWSYHHELYGNQYEYDEVLAVPLNGC
jgi:hypothetical protein